MRLPRTYTSPIYGSTVTEKGEWTEADERFSLRLAALVTWAALVGVVALLGAGGVLTAAVAIVTPGIVALWALADRVGR